MFHATRTWLTRLATRIRACHLARDLDTAAACGWQVRQVTATTHRYRDPRFGPLACPECGEPAIRQAPTDLVPWHACGLAAPQWSHADRSALCPVIGPGGYQPATPVPASLAGRAQ